MSNPRDVVALVGSLRKESYKVCLNVPMLRQPEAYISGVDKLFDGQGGIVNAPAKGFLGKFLTTFASWIERTAPR